MPSSQRHHPWLLALLWLAPLSVAMAHGISQADQKAMLAAGYTQYIWLGASHMLTGYDHLLFLLGVVFFLTGFRDIVKFITVFTLGHSITLLFATIWGITANYYLVDAVIAISVIYKGFENIDGFKQYLGMEKSPNLLWMVFGFGLIHGFGLSTRLQQLPLGDKGMVMRILSFNVGVELGQIAGLALMLILIRMWRNAESLSWDTFSRAANVGLIIAGLLLFLMQMHGYMHTAYPDEFGFSKDHHYHHHLRMKHKANAQDGGIPHGHSHGPHGHKHPHGHSHGPKGHSHSHGKPHSHGPHGHKHPHGHSHGPKGHSHGPKGHSHGPHGHSHGKSHSHGKPHNHGPKGHSHGPKGHSHGPKGHSHGPQGHSHGHHPVSKPTSRPIKRR